MEFPQTILFNFRHRERFLIENIINTIYLAIILIIKYNNPIRVIIINIDDRMVCKTEIRELKTSIQKDTDTYTQLLISRYVIDKNSRLVKSDG